MTTSYFGEDYIAKNCKVTLVPRVKKQRIWELDFLRGFCILLMVLDHLALLIWMEFGASWCGGRTFIDGGWVFKGDGFLTDLCNFCYRYWSSDLRYYGHPLVLFFFFSICGISCSFSRSNLKRGIQLALVALGWSVLSFIGEYVFGISGIFVHFGVLSLLASCILFYAFMDFICFKNKIAKFTLSGALVIVILCLYHLYRPTEPIDGIYAFIFSSTADYGMPIVFEHHFTTLNSFSPGDLFTVVPWAAFFFFGTFISPLLYGEKKSLLKPLDGKWNKPICFVGRHALVIYLLHVLILGALLMLISYLFITPGNWVMF